MDQNKLPLCAVLTPEQFKQVCRIWQNTPEPEQVKALKDYLGTFRQELSAKGVDSDYLAYWLFAKFTGVI